MVTVESAKTDERWGVQITPLFHKHSVLLGPDADTALVGFAVGEPPCTRLAQQAVTRSTACAMLLLLSIETCCDFLCSCFLLRCCRMAAQLVLWGRSVQLPQSQQQVSPQAGRFPSSAQQPPAPPCQTLGTSSSGLCRLTSSRAMQQQTC